MLSSEAHVLERPAFKKTIRQKLAIILLGGAARFCMLFGGSRSGKTFILVYAVVVRALKVQSRHVILRLQFNHAKTSIWMDTLPKVLKLCFPDLEYHENKTDYVITFPNGSELWVAGLDNEKHLEKILGKEYSTIYFNECSQIPYTSITMALTRLAERNSLTKKAYFDENPPSKKHWSYWLFIKGLDPIENVPINKEKYASLIMNPADNLENIDPDYIDEVLAALPEKQRARFERGEFTDDGDGLAYYEFDRDRHVQEVKKVDRHQILIGMDFNVDPMTAVMCNHVNGVFHIFDEAYLENSDTPKMCSHLSKKNYSGAFVYPDSTGKNRKTSGKADHKILTDEGFIIKGVQNPFVTDRVSNINRLLKAGRIIIDPSCKKLINDLEKVSWKDNQLDQKTDKHLTHISDALGYLCWAIDNIVYNSRKSSTIQG
jgi:PBSX family phage terminase large subunit